MKHWAICGFFLVATSVFCADGPLPEGGFTIARQEMRKAFTKLAKEIMIAARNGAEIDMNPRLRLAVEAAKKASMPRDTLERAIKKGAGLLDENVVYETVVYEGFAPHKVPVIVECLTDNKNRTATNVRVLFRKGQLASSGAVSWDFAHLGVVQATPPAGGGIAVDAEAAAIEAQVAQMIKDLQDGSAQTVIDKVALPIEEQVNGVEGMIYMESSSTNDGNCA
jgi:YebC/PmpR family DNA-binding regulatory protein